MQAPTAKQEWAAMWPLPLAAMLGMSGTGMFVYSSGVFMGDMTAEFGWSRAQFSFTLTLLMLAGLIFLPMLGWCVDRWGPRRMALFGIVTFAAGFAMLGLANGSILQWYALALLYAPFQAFIGQPIWIAGVVSRFDASRGLAMAVALAGLGIASMVWPLLTAFYIEALGWRLTYVALALSWVIPVLPLTLLFFYGAGDRSGPAKPRPERQAYGPALRSRTFIGLMLAGGLFICGGFGITVHIVPILRGDGFSLGSAAAIAGLVGAFSFTGRLLTGYLLDRFPTRPIAVTVFLMPILTSVLLLLFPGSLAGAVGAVIMLGLSGGAEMDIVTFIAARRFGPGVFASIFALFSAIIAACAGLGAVLAGAIFDMQQSYDAYLLLVIPMMLASAGLIAWLPMEPEQDAAGRRGNEPLEPAGAQPSAP